MSCLQQPHTPDFNLSVEVVVTAMQKISGRSWCLLGFSNPLCDQEIFSPQLQACVGQDRPLWNSGTPCIEQWDSLHLTFPPHDSWVQSKGMYYRPVPDLRKFLKPLQLYFGDKFRFHLVVVVVVVVSLFIQPNPRAQNVSRP